MVRLTNTDRTLDREGFSWRSGHPRQRFIQTIPRLGRGLLTLQLRSSSSRRLETGWETPLRLRFSTEVGQGFASHRQKQLLQVVSHDPRVSLPGVILSLTSSKTTDTPRLRSDTQTTRAFLLLGGKSRAMLSKRSSSEVHAHFTPCLSHSPHC